MKFKRMVPFGALGLCVLWLGAIFVPLFYSASFPNPDVERILSGLKGQASAPAEVVPLVERTLAATGPLRRSLQVAYYAEVKKTWRAGGSHITKQRQATYLAWFEKLPHPLLLVITRYERDGAEVSYAIGEGELTSMLQAYALPLFVSGLSLYFVLRRKAPGDSTTE